MMKIKSRKSENSMKENVNQFWTYLLEENILSQFLLE